MKQTIAILTALCICLMAVSGFLLNANMKEIRLSAQKDQELAQLRATVTKLTGERDAISLQWQDAVLASQEANEAVAVQNRQRLRLEQALNAANMELETLRETLENAHQPQTAP